MITEIDMLRISRWCNNHYDFALSCGTLLGWRVSPRVTVGLLVLNIGLNRYIDFELGNRNEKHIHIED